MSQYPPQPPQWQRQSQQQIQPSQTSTGRQQLSGSPQQPGGYPPMMPPPLPSAKKLSRRTWIIIGVIVLILIIISAANSKNTPSTDTSTTPTTFIQATVAPTDTPVPTDTPAPTDTPTPQPSLAYQLASIDAGGSVSSNDASIAQYQILLDTLHRKTGDSEQTISDETVAGRDLVKSKYGKDVTLLALLQDVDQSVPDGTTIHYNEALAAYITLAYS